MSDDMVQVSHLVPKSVKEDAQKKAEHGELSDAVRKTYEIIAYGGDYEDTFRLEQQLDRARAEYERLVEDKEDVERKIRETAETIETLEERLESIESAKSNFEEQIQELERGLKTGEHIFPSHGKVERAAEAGRMSPEEVIDLLQERNPDVPDHAFVPAHEADFVWRGVTET